MSAAPFSTLPRPLLFGHRGASARAPENTLEAFELAVQAGVDVLEMDVHLSRDGVVVVHHDASVARTTNGVGAVRGFALAELQALDAGFRFRDASGGYAFRGAGCRIDPGRLNTKPGLAGRHRSGQRNDEAADDDGDFEDEEMDDENNA